MQNKHAGQAIVDSLALHGVKRVFFMSSLSVHRFDGWVDAGEDTPMAPEGYFPYCVSKGEAERLAFDLARERGVTLSAARTGVVFGANDHNTFLRLADGVRGGLYAHVAGGGTYLPVSCVSNLLDGIVLCATRDEAAGRVYNLVDDGKTTWREFVDAVCDALGWKRVTRTVALGVARATGAILEDAFRLVRAKTAPPVTRYRVAYVAKHLHFSNARARRELGFDPRVTIQEEMARAASWYLAKR